MCIGHAKIYIYPTLVSCEKSTDKIANYTGKPLIPTGIPLRTDCIDVSFWFFEFVRYLAVCQPYRSVCRHRGSAVRAIGSVGWTPSSTTLFFLNLTSIQPTLCLLLSLPFHSRNPPPSARVLLSTLPCPVAARVFHTTSFIFLRWQVVLPSLKAIRLGKVILSIWIDEAAP
jgi:hypothetical protein